MPESKDLERTNDNKPITLSLGDEDHDYDITEAPSYCNVFLKKHKQVTFESDSPFAVTFDKGSPFKQAGPIFIGIPGGRLKFHKTLDLSDKFAVDPNAERLRRVFKYRVTLTDPRGQDHTDDDCPTIIVGELRH